MSSSSQYFVPRSQASSQLSNYSKVGAPTEHHYQSIKASPQQPLTIMSSVNSGCRHPLALEGSCFANCSECGCYLPLNPNCFALWDDKKEKFNFEVCMQEVIEKMVASEETNRPYDPSKKGFLRYRRVLVDWMCEVGDQIKLQSSTIHHAVALVDTYFSKVADVQRSEASKKYLQLIGFTCIFFSAKYCEKDSWGPTAHDIAYLSMKTFTEQ